MDIPIPGFRVEPGMTEVFQPSRFIPKSALYFTLSIPIIGDMGDPFKASMHLARYLIYIEKPNGLRSDCVMVFSHNFRSSIIGLQSGLHTLSVLLRLEAYRPKTPPIPEENR